MIGRSVIGSQRNTRKVEHLQNCGRTEFILERKTHQIQICHRSACLQGHQFETGASHLIFHIGPRSECSFSVQFAFGVHDGIKNLQSEMRHSHFVNVRKTHPDPQSDFADILSDRVNFFSDISCRLLHVDQYLIQIMRIVVCLNTIHFTVFHRKLLISQSTRFAVTEMIPYKA